MPESVPKYIPVDNAAQIFIPVFSQKETTMSRIALNLKAPLDKERFSSALKSIIKRFPFFQVYLKKSFFEYVFERTDDLPQIEGDEEWPNRFVDFKKKKFLFRIKVTDSKIIAEVSHILSDGFGTMSFLLSLVAEYFKIGGHPVGSSVFVKTPNEEIFHEEWKCAYREKFSRKGPMIKLPSPAYIPKAAAIDADKYYSMRICMELEPVRLLARKHNVTLNVYLAAIYTYALQELYFEDITLGHKNKGKPIRIEIPVDLRKFHKTQCLRNFSYLYSPTFDFVDSKYSFDSIIQKISEDIHYERHSGSIEKQIARNLRLENNIFFKYLPNFLKQPLFKLFYNLFGRQLYSGVITNFGDIKIPEELKKHVDSFEILPTNTPVPGRNTSIFSYNGKLEMNIGSSCKDLRFERYVLKMLNDLSIKYDLINNRDDYVSV